MVVFIRIVLGVRDGGRVLSHGGEHAETRFFCAASIPLFALRSRWVTDNGTPNKRAFDIPLYARSLVAFYLRTWALVAAAAVAMTLHNARGVAIALILVAASAWSWTWVGRISARSRRRSDMDLLAFGYRCPPEIMAHHERERLSQVLASRLARHGNPRPADDVLRFGAHDFEELIAAYGLLRLTPQRAAQAAAETCLTRVIHIAPEQGGPFRATPTAGLRAPADFADEIRHELAVRRARRAALRAQMPKKLYERPRVQLVVLVAASVVACGLTFTRVGPAPTMSASDLAGSTVPERRVKVTCDDAPTPLSPRISLCQIDGRALTIVWPPTDASPSPVTALTLDGYLSPLRSYVWLEPAIADRLRANVPRRVYAYALELQLANEYWRLASLIVLFDVLLGLGWRFWLRGWRGRRERTTAPKLPR